MSAKKPTKTTQDNAAHGGCSAVPCSACGGSGMGPPMYRPCIDKTQRDRCYTCKGTGKKSDGNAMFDPDILSRAVMDSETAEAFRLESRQVILRDEITDARVVCYRHPDGRVLVDAIRLPNADVLAPAGEKTPTKKPTL